MKTNYERAERIKASTQRITLLAATTKTFKETAQKEEDSLIDISRGNTNEDEVENDDDDETVTDSDDELSDND